MVAERLRIEMQIATRMLLQGELQKRSKQLRVVCF
jgi:hypothetical protein